MASVTRSGPRSSAPSHPTRRPAWPSLDVHGAKHPGRVSDQFRTPYDLAIAAECESELDENASVTELHAAYIRRFAPTEQIRAGLRTLATHLHTKLRTSLPLLEANSILNSATVALTARQVDDVLLRHGRRRITGVARSSFSTTMSARPRGAASAS
ncbi:MAG: hypothetical protein H0V33_09345 [Acidimicrobiia bacterium]|jgi:hypothetical protein|nr:hypothetical protein [Acidimicrobiia bacterium]